MLPWFFYVSRVADLTTPEPSSLNALHPYVSIPTHQSVNHTPLINATCSAMPPYGLNRKGRPQVHAFDLLVSSSQCHFERW